MNAFETLTYLVLGIFLGMVGQCLRAVVGVKKSSDEASFSGEAFKDWFEMKRLIFSLILGAATGALGAISLLGTPLNKEFLLSIIAAGYAGTDFIEGFMRARGSNK
jgi:H+/Cl- antiporter ClcA